MGARETFSADRHTVLITGANRGLGLAFAGLYANKGWNVIATCRSPRTATALNDLADTRPQLVVETLDVTRDDQVAALAAAYASQPVDVLLNNALGPLRVAKAFLPNVAASRHKKIISLGGGHYAMKMSKAA